MGIVVWKEFRDQHCIVTHHTAFQETKPRSNAKQSILGYDFAITITEATTVDILNKDENLPPV